MLFCLNMQKRRTLTALPVLLSILFFLQYTKVVATAEEERSSSKTPFVEEQEEEEAPVVQLVSGKVKGHTVYARIGSAHASTNSSVYLYEGIRYGRIEGRFEVAKEAAHWDGVYRAVGYKEACPQLPSGRMFARILSLLSMTNSSSETDCLYLNVWRPVKEEATDPANRKRAVMVWIHGGAFEVQPYK